MTETPRSQAPSPPPAPPAKESPPAPRTAGDGGSEAPKGVLLAVGLVSAATLAVEVLQTRLFSVMLWHHLTYMAVTVTLLGFAAGGSLLAMWPGLGRAHGDPRVATSACCSLFAVSLIAAFAMLGRSPLDTLDVEQDRAKYFSLFLHYAYLLVPFLFAGLAIAIPLKEYGASMHRTYFWNLVGSGAGSFLFLLLIRPLGGQGCLMLVASLGGLAGLLALAGRRDHSSWPTAFVAVVAAAAWPMSLLAPDTTAELIPIRAAQSKAQTMFTGLFDALADHYRRLDQSYPGVDPKLRHTLWTPTCRVDTVPVPPAPAQVSRDREQPAAAPRGQVHVFQDGDAPTVIWSGPYAEEFAFDTYFYGLAYRLLQNPRVLVIGPGGGVDVETALHYGAASVTAVDINGDLLDLIRREPFKSYTADIYRRPNVHAVHAEGRSFLRRQGGIYDLIQLSGTDTYAALSSGSYIFSESYLYTEEAFEDYFAHLAENGVLCIIRFGFKPPREALKLVATAARALQRKGADPRRHVMVVDQEDVRPQQLAQEIDRHVTDRRQREQLAGMLTYVKEPMRYTLTLMRRTPFSVGEVEAIATALEPMNAPGVTYSLPYGAWQREQDAATEYGRLLGAIVQGPSAEEAFYAAYPCHVVPATDDQPFFFHSYRWSDVELFGGGSSRDGYAGLTGSQPIGLYVLAALLVQTAIATLLLVIAPLLRLGLGSRTDVSRLRVLIYFAALGLGYLLVEITTIQRFVLYLGHPTYSLSAGLGCFLLFSGLGSAVGGRLGGSRRLAAASALGVVALLVAHGFVLPEVLHRTLTLPEAARVGMTVVWVAPLAVAMGVPFPTGLKLLGGRAPGLVPWALGINGGASVLASILSIVGAMQWGFTAVFLAAAALYLIAAFSTPRAD